VSLAATGRSGDEEDQLGVSIRAGEIYTAA